MYTIFLYLNMDAFANILRRTAFMYSGFTCRLCADPKSL